MRTIPDFFIVGAGRSGTTAMHTYLAEHPQIFMPEAKELNHFCTDFKAYIPNTWLEKYRDRGVYQAQFADANSEQCVGEASPTYLPSKVAAQNIYEFNPHAKIIVMLRSPIEVMFSAYHKLLLTENEDLCSFEKALDAEQLRKMGQKIPANLSVMIDVLYYRENVQYTKHLRRYFEVFPRDAIHIIIYDDFGTDIAKTYRELLGFLGVDLDFAPNFQKMNKTLGLRSVRLHNILLNPPNWLYTIGQAVKPIAKPISLAARNFNLVSEKPVMRPETRRKLQLEFRDEINNLSELLDRDLTHWYKD